jgi:lipoyl(octanoyl) transferase
VIKVVQLGTIDYATGLRLQQCLVELRKQGGIDDVLLLLEHTPVITLGRNAKTANVLASPEQLAARGVEVFECDRGGDVTFHGPGQLVAYPIFDLHGLASSDPKRKTLGAVEFVRKLEEVLIRTCAGFGIETQRITGLTGVWTQAAVSAKIAAIGVHISSGVTSHGFALNVNTDLDYFNLIVPCGIVAKPVTSIQNELRREVGLAEVANTVAPKFGEVFGREILEVSNLDALLGEDVPLKFPRDLRELHKEEESFWA